MSFNSRKSGVSSRDVTDYMKNMTLSSRSSGSSSIVPGLKTKTPTAANAFALKKARSRNVTPSRNHDFRGITIGDRYVSQRDEERIEYAGYVMDKACGNLNVSSSAPTSPQKLARSLALHRPKSLANVDKVDDVDFFIYRRKGAPRVAGQVKSNTLYKCMDPSSSVRKAVRERVYSTFPTQIFDAPGIVDDFYNNCHDWSAKNLIAVGLNDKVFLWDAETNESILLHDPCGTSNRVEVDVTCVKYSNDGKYLAVGLGSGKVLLFDVGKKVLTRTFQPSTTRVGVLSWTRSGLLAMGTRQGVFQVHDVRQRLSFVCEVEEHVGELTSIYWCYNDEFLVVGSADAAVTVYTQERLKSNQLTPLYRLESHVSTVKAICEVSYLPGKCIATGGGTNDGKVIFWDLRNGTEVASFETGKQISSLVCDAHYREIVTGHGFPNAGIMVWSAPGIAGPFKSAHDVPFTHRCLGIIKSPCGQLILCLAGDETLSIYDFFKKDPKPETTRSRKDVPTCRSIRQCIR